MYAKSKFKPERKKLRTAVYDDIVASVVLSQEEQSSSSLPTEEEDIESHIQLLQQKKLKRPSLLPEDLFNSEKETIIVLIS